MSWKILEGDALTVLKTMGDQSINCVVTSPPYWGLRDYGIEGQLGLEDTPELYVEKVVEIFQEIWRVLRNDGSVWINLGDTYAGTNDGMKIPPNLKPKDLIGIPWRVAFALQAENWYLRNDIIWHKTNPMPEAVKDRLTRAHEYIFLLTKKKNTFMTMMQ